MRQIKTIPLALVCTLLASCATTKFSNNFRGKYKFETTSNPEFLDVNVAQLPLAKETKPATAKEKTFFDLRDSVPHKYLEVVGAKAKDVDEIIKAVKAPLSEKAKAPKKSIDIPHRYDNQFQVRLLFSNIKKYFISEKYIHPNTRLERLNTTITIEGDLPLTIYSVDKISNELETIDLGLLERSNQVNFSSGLSGELGQTYSNTNSRTNNSTSGSSSNVSNLHNVYDENGNVLGTINNAAQFEGTQGSGNSSTSNLNVNNAMKADLQYANTENIKEALNLKLKKIKTGFSFGTDRLTVSQLGWPLSDISDNAIITLTLENSDANETETTRTLKLSNLYNDKGFPNGIDQIKIEEQHITYVHCIEEDIEADVKEAALSIYYEGALRAVKNGRASRNLLEYDDKVKYYSFKKDAGATSSIIFDQDEYCHSAYKIKAIGKDASDVYYLKRNDLNGYSTIFIYDDDKPQLVAKWIADLVRCEKISQTPCVRQWVFVNQKDPSIRIPLSAKAMTKEELALLKDFTTIELEDLLKAEKEAYKKRGKEKEK